MRIIIGMNVKFLRNAYPLDRQLQMAMQQADDGRMNSIDRSHRAAVRGLVVDLNQVISLLSS